MRMTAIYARVWSEQQREENTIASQTAALIECAKDHDLEVPKEWAFEDKGYSGATLERPGLERVRDLASEGQIQTVLVYAPDRLSRKYAYQILLIEELPATEWRRCCQSAAGHQRRRSTTGAVPGPPCCRRLILRSCSLLPGNRRADRLALDIEPSDHVRSVPDGHLSI
jgi:Resolvase, N terminal domain